MISLEIVHILSLKQAWETIQPDDLEARLTVAITPPGSLVYVETKK